MPQPGDTVQSESAVLETEETGEEIVNENAEESPEESARLALIELQEGNENAEGDSSPAAEEDSERAPENAQSNVVREAQTPETQLPEPEAEDPADFEPPSRLSAKERQLFNKMPKQLRPAVARMFKDVQAQQTKWNQEYSRATNDAKHILETVRPYYVSNPAYAEAGITEAGFISALVAAHQRLTDPKTDRQTIEKLAKDRGYQIKFVGEDGQEVSGTTSAQQDITQHPQFKALQQQQNQLLQIVQGERTQKVTEPIIAEWRQIADQKDSSGRWVHPEMQQNEFWVQARPLISHLAQTGLSYSEALKRAYYSLTGKQPLTQNQATRPPAASNTQSRAVSAAVSVRGRAAPPAVTPRVNGIDVSANETPEQSAMIALEELRRGMV